MRAGYPAGGPHGIPAGLVEDLAAALDPCELAAAVGLSVDDWQRDALRSGSRRAIWLCARQTGKSTTAALLALHEALFSSPSLTLLVSPSLRQSGELFRTIAGLLARMDVRPTLVEESRLSLSLEGGARIVSLPSSETTVRGFAGVTLLIEDEASRVPDALFFATRPMLATTNGRHVLLSTPFGTRGHFYETWEHGGPGWERVRVAAEDCPRIGSDFLAEERATLGDFWYQQEYGCVFLDAQSQAFGRAEVDAMFAEEVETWTF